MKAKRAPAGKRFVLFLAIAAGVGAALAAIGYLPTKRVGGPDAVPAMLAGCAVSVAASVVGVVPLIFGLGGPNRPVALAALMAMGLRFVAVLALTLAVALSGWFDRAPLLIWVAISYLVLLVADTWYAVRLGGDEE